MTKRLVIKNPENKKYFTGNYDGWWSFDIKDARSYEDEKGIEKEIKEQTNTENDLDSFKGIICVIVETVYIK